MAKQQGKVYLGYEDELVIENNKTALNYTVNKIGGLPDWPPLENLQFSMKCPLCNLHRLLVVQCYAPLENSVFHRTLYVFACINPNCWNQSESWTCVRSQIEDNSVTQSSISVDMPTPETNLSWCQGSDDWDENDNGDTTNGNFMNVDNAISPDSGIQRHSDDDEESTSFELESMEQALGDLHVFDATNANNFPMQGAVGDASVPQAELEGRDESDLVTVDTPTAPTSNVEALLQQTAELPSDIRSRLMVGPLQFVAKFIYVEEEWKKHASNDDKVIELLNKYKRENDMDASNVADKAGGGGGDDEVYEEAAPLHGDRLFHAFITRLRSNPGQILRYSRDHPPLLGAMLPSTENSPDPSKPSVCLRCGSSLICELQLVPGFAETLRLLPNNVSLPYLHFLSVLVFTCSQSCWQSTDTLVKETIVFQPEVI